MKDSSKKKLFKELLGFLSTEGKEYWRSSPALYSTGESSDGSTGGMKRKHKLNYVSATPTPSSKSSKISGIWPTQWSDSDWSGDETGGEDSPPSTPPSNEEIYKLLLELEK
ncbi:ORF3 [Grizzly bear anellovirus 5]|nr:ORF3 [Grizzly bear anellovirus 5]